MRILQVVHDFVDTNLAGTELYTYYLSRELLKKHEVGVLYYSNNTKDKLDLRQSQYNGISTFIINLPPPYLDRWCQVNYQTDGADQMFGKVLSLFQPDVIHFQHLAFASMNFPNIAKSFGIATLHTLHDFYLICAKFNLINNLMDRCDIAKPLRCFLCCLEPKPYSTKNLVRRLLMDSECRRLLFHLSWKRNRFVNLKVFRNIDLFISPSKFLRNKFIQHGLSSENIIFSDNGMNLEILNGNQSVRHTENNCMTFGYLGGHQVKKGISLLIHAFNQIEEARLFIYGSSEDEAFKSLASNPNIHFKGVINDAEKWGVFSELDVLIVPSICFENSPLTIHEAFIFNTPVIVSDIGGAAELVDDGISGLHFKVGDVQDLREKIMFCIDHPEVVQRMGTMVPKVKSIQENAQELESIYSNILEKGKS